jgi:triosephosphate isomerase
LAVCGGQLAASLPDLAAGCEMLIAYEPLWAIGSGHMPTDEDIVAVHGHIRSCLVARFREAGQAVRILYGGSVTSSNARGILWLPDVGGVLIGGASLTAADFDAVLGVARTLASTQDAVAAE